MPEFGKEAFNCPHCGAYAHQVWHKNYSISSAGILKTSDTVQVLRGLSKGYGVIFPIGEFTASVCYKCNNFALWVDDSMVYPKSSIAPMPADDMPDDVKEDFIEARYVVNASPRSAAALLRLALEKLVTNHLEANGSDLNGRIGDLVSRGLPDKIAKSLDSVRVLGNEAVHPGQIDLRDNVHTAIAMFGLLNIIVEKMITEPKRIDEIYEILPETKKTGILERDKKSQSGK